MTRSIYNYRPRNEPDAIPYAPQRDVAHVYTPMLQEVFLGLDEENWTPQYRDFFEEQGITAEHVGEGVAMFLEAHRLFIRDREVSTPAEAFEKAGMRTIRHELVMAIFARIGQVVAGGWFMAVRDVTVQGQPTPLHADFVNMIAAGREVAARLSGHSVGEDRIDDIAILQADLQENERICQQLRSQVSDYGAAVDTQVNYNNDYVKRYLTPTIVADQVWESKGIKRVFAAIKAGWRLYKGEPGGPVPKRDQ